MARIWSEEGKLAAWLEVELAATEALAELGAIPAGAAAEIRERAVGEPPCLVAPRGASAFAGGASRSGNRLREAAAATA